MRNFNKVRDLYGDGILINNISKYNVTKYTNNTLNTELNYHVVPPAAATRGVHVTCTLLCNTREFETKLVLN